MVCRGFMLFIPAVDPVMDANGHVVPDETPLIFYIAMINAFVYFLPHVLMAASLFSVARRRNLPAPWLAWIPFANYWTLGCIADGYRTLKYCEDSSKRKWLAVLGGLVVALMVLEALAEFAELNVMALICLMVLLLVVAILNIALLMTLFDLYESCNPKISVAFLVLSVVLWFAQPLLVFLCRKKDRGIPNV